MKATKQYFPFELVAEVLSKDIEIKAITLKYMVQCAVSFLLKSSERILINFGTPTM